MKIRTYIATSIYIILAIMLPIMLEQSKIIYDAKVTYNTMILTTSNLLSLFILGVSMGWAIKCYLKAPVKIILLILSSVTIFSILGAITQNSILMTYLMRYYQVINKLVMLNAVLLVLSFKRAN